MTSNQQSRQADKSKMEAILKNFGVCVDVSDCGCERATLTPEIYGEWDEERKESFISSILGGGDKKKEEEEHTCCLCDKKYKGYGNNPAPLAEEGRCCDECNTTKVVPARFAAVEEEIKAKKWLQKLLAQYLLNYKKNPLEGATRIGWGAGYRLGSTPEPEWFKDVEGEQEIASVPQAGGNDGWTISRRTNTITLTLGYYLNYGTFNKHYKFDGSDGDWACRNGAWECEPTIRFRLEDGTYRCATFHITPVPEEHYPKIQHGREIDFLVWKITDHKDCPKQEWNMDWAGVLDAQRIEKEAKQKKKEKQQKALEKQQKALEESRKRYEAEKERLDRLEAEKKARDEEETKKRQEEFEARLKALEVKEAERKEEEKREKEEKARKAEAKRAEREKEHQAKQAKWSKK